MKADSEVQTSEFPPIVSACDRDRLGSGLGASPSLLVRSLGGSRSPASAGPIAPRAISGSPAAAAAAAAAAERSDSEQLSVRWILRRWRNIEAVFWRQRGSTFLWRYLSVSCCDLAFFFFFCRASLARSRGRHRFFLATSLGGVAFSLFHPLRLASSGYEYGTTAGRTAVLARYNTPTKTRVKSASFLYFRGLIRSSLFPV